MSWKGSLRACETVGVLEGEEENVLDPSLTCVPLDVMSLLWVCFPSGKMGMCTEWAARFHLYCESWPLRERCREGGLGKVKEGGGAPGKPRPSSPQPSPWKGLLLVWMR